MAELICDWDWKIVAIYGRVAMLPRRLEEPRSDVSACRSSTLRAVISLEVLLGCFGKMVGKHPSGYFILLGKICWEAASWIKT